MKKYCQSCAMPLDAKEGPFGTEADGSPNTDYCAYCLADGKFVDDFSMEEMIEACLPHMLSYNKGMSEGMARKMMREVFPTLKRWKGSTPAR